jgi:glycosyltransferase involved in cell wall biosynthesis
MADLHHYNDGRQIRDAIHQADIRAMGEVTAVYTIADNVSRRLITSTGMRATTLYHPPPGADHFYCDEAEDYLFFPSRITPVKRQALVLEAMAHTRQEVRVCFVGTPDHPPYAEGLQALAMRLRIDRRVRWLGSATDQEKIQLYARALGVMYPPVDEDYGYVTLEAMLSAKPVLTCTDSGGPLEFVRHGETGLIAEPTPVALAEAMDRVWENREQARRWGAQGKAEYQRRAITWTGVVERLLA